MPSLNVDALVASEDEESPIAGITMGDPDYSDTLMDIASTDMAGKIVFNSPNGLMRFTETSGITFCGWHQQ